MEVDGEKVITSEHALTLDRVPASVIVLGGGVIGCEFASVWRSFGAEVTIVEALPRLMAAEDADSSKQLERAFRKRKIKALTATSFNSVETTDAGVKVTISDGSVLEAELLLVAVGRGPATDLLAISLSPNDILGHGIGPDSAPMQQMALDLDRQIAEFINFLGHQIGLADVWIAL